MSHGYINLTEVTPGSANAWTDVDLSSLIPSGATGVSLKFVNPSGGALAIGARKNGSTDNRTGTLGGSAWTTLTVGVDGSRIVEIYVGHTTNVDVYLTWWCDASCGEFLANAANKSTGTAGAYQDVDNSADTGASTAILAFFEVINSGTFGIRRNGATEDPRYSNSNHHGVAAVLDGSEICEQFISSTVTDLFLNGWLIAEFTGYTDALDRSEASTFGSYADVTALPSGADGGLYRGGTATFGVALALRKKGASDDYYRDILRQVYAIVEADASQQIEQKAEDSSVDLFEVGYLTTAGVSGSLAVTLAAATLSAAGAVAVAGTATPTLAAVTVTSAGTVAVAGAAAVTLGAATLSATGAVAVVGSASPTLGAATLSASGGVATAGTVAATFDDATLSAAGVAQVAAAVAVTLGSITLTAEGVVPVVGALAITMDALTPAATGAVAATGAAAGTLDDCVLVATGGGGVEAALVQTLADCTSLSTATVAITGAVAATLANVTAAATGAVSVTGQVAVSLADCTLSATSGSGVVGQVAITLDAVQTAAAGQVAVTASVVAALAPASSTATATVAVAGTVSVTLEAASLAAAAVGPGISGEVNVTLQPCLLAAAGVGPDGLDNDSLVTTVDVQQVFRTVTISQAVRTISVE